MLCTPSLDPVLSDIIEDTYITHNDPLAEALLLQSNLFSPIVNDACDTGHFSGESEGFL